MNKLILLVSVVILELGLKAQTNPAITSWLQNTTVTGRHYVSGNSIPIDDADLVNVQSVQYSTDYVYVSATGIPAYVTGPFLDGNPSLATAQNSIFKFPLNPVQNTGTPTATNMGNIGVFINGTALFDNRDGVAWNNSSSSLCGGPGNSPCPGGPTAVMDWNRDAIPAEKAGFDCSKGHPAMGNYHHHQNPSAFKLDLNVVSTICNTYDADGLYAIDSTKHSPLIGFAYDGFPIYGAYAYAETNGTGGITRMKSGYELTGATTRTNGPVVNSTYFEGYFKEDYVFVSHPGQNDYLDEHNGRFCVTPEYPAGTYCYFATVDENWNSTYPYAVGPTFYGVKSATTVTNITESVTTYESTTGISDYDLNSVEINLFPNPANDFVVIQLNSLVKENVKVKLFDITGKFISETVIYQGTTIAHIDTRSLYAGQYIVKFVLNEKSVTRKLLINK
ncbi:YHYH protein [Vicingus serpentipes]|uniref:YHYH protein n=1 Tax=Vicingus serpentipes TaxID=1926625 RepID=A0A5C6RV19_9FLAO|nr:YHYH protein [Vicingus serpentipes]TXB65904.1 YHYH protein [Vicingus serpentipes]